MKKVKLLTRLKTKVSARTLLLVALGIAIVGGVAIIFPLSAFKTLKMGSLTVNISPKAAVSAGAKWRIVGKEWLNSGSTKKDIVAGNYTVEFSNIKGFQTSLTQNVTIVAGRTTTINKEYYGSVNCVPEGGSLGAVVPGNKAKCCAGLVEVAPPRGLLGSYGTCQKPAVIK